MPDEVVLPEYMERFIAETDRWAKSVLHVEPPPAEVIRTVQALQPQIDGVMAAMEQLAATSSVAGILARQQESFARMAESFAATYRLPVPTPQELSEADVALRARVLPGTTDQELQEAVAEIPADPEKLKLAAFLIDVLRRAASISPTPYAVFVLVFWVAMKMDAKEIAALALAYTVMRDYKPRN